MFDCTFSGGEMTADGLPRWLKFPCPSGGGGRCSVPLKPHQKNGYGASWTWDGDRMAPTLTESISCGVCKRHGFIRAGVWVAA